MLFCHLSLHTSFLLRRLSFWSSFGYFHYHTSFWSHCLSFQFFPSPHVSLVRMFVLLVTSVTKCNFSCNVCPLGHVTTCLFGHIVCPFGCIVCHFFHHMSFWSSCLSFWACCLSYRSPHLISVACLSFWSHCLSCRSDGHHMSVRSRCLSFRLHHLLFRSPHVSSVALFVT
jgi:hypothetical protein